MNTGTNTQLLFQEIKDLNRLQVGFIQQCATQLTPDELCHFENYLLFCIDAGISIPYLGASYDLLVKDIMREQMYFKRHGKYRYSRYSEVAESVYMNDDYMTKYMYGLAISSFLWPNHVEFHRWFIAKLPKTHSGRYLEIGPGHGYYFMTAMRETSFSSYEGVDISPSSVKLTQTILASPRFKRGTNYRIREANFLLEEPKEKYDAIVMSEVLEHVESPGHFVEKIRTVAKKDSFIFLTTAINAPAVDHIYLFDTAQSFYRLVEDAGLRILDKLPLPYAGKTLEQSIEGKFPVNIALTATV